MAKDYLFGAGFDLARPDLFAIYSPTPDMVHAAVRARLMTVLAELDQGDDRARRGPAAGPVVIELSGLRPAPRPGDDDNHGPN